MPHPNEDELYTAIHRVTWKRRTTGLLAAATVGIGLGVLIGAAVAFLPWAAAAFGSMSMAGAALPGLGAIAASASLYAVVGGLLGGTFGTEVGANAGSGVASLLALDKDQKGGLDLPPPGPEPKQGLGNYINPKVALMTGTLFAAFGALALFAAPTALAASTINLLTMGGFAAGSHAAIAAGAVIFGMFGATLGVNAPLLTAKLSNFYTKMVTGRLTLLGTPVQEPNLTGQPLIKEGKELAPSNALDLLEEKAEPAPRRFTDTIKQSGLDTHLADATNHDALSAAWQR